VVDLRPFGFSGVIAECLGGGGEEVGVGEDAGEGRGVAVEVTLAFVLVFGGGVTGSGGEERWPLPGLPWCVDGVWPEVAVTGAGALALRMSLELATVHFRGPRKPSVFQTPDLGPVSTIRDWMYCRVSTGTDAMIILVCLPVWLYSRIRPQGAPWEVGVSNMRREASKYSCAVRLSKPFGTKILTKVVTCSSFVQPRKFLLLMRGISLLNQARAWGCLQLITPQWMI